VVDDLFSDGDVDLIIVEADGSRGLPLKGPGTEEPAIPGLASIVVPVAGLGGLGRPLGKDTTFRPERFGRLAGLEPGQTVTPESLARVLFHEQGLCRNLPEKARLVAFLNQADLVSPEVARTAAEAAYDAGPDTLARVIWGSLNNPVAGFGLWPE
ncbi:MAG: putative selenium-dependent hydroxylase accessory protein YqeC, partial [Proteobacteria bacterium]|nr:putative selenium-dependent hydroxylase accessory protein YqeC [Pseudomonadota bacterium]